MNEKYVAKITTEDGEDTYTVLLNEKNFRLVDFLDKAGLIRGQIDITSYSDSEVYDFA